MSVRIKSGNGRIGKIIKKKTNGATIYAIRSAPRFEIRTTVVTYCSKRWGKRTEGHGTVKLILLCLQCKQTIQETQNQLIL